MEPKTLAHLLEYAADLMEVLGENAFKAQAYRKTARSLEKSELPLSTLAQQKFEGMAGPALAPLLVEAVQSGQLALVANLEDRLPPGVLELFRVQGLGPKRIGSLWGHGITSLTELIAAGQAGQLRQIPGFGAKTEANLVEAAQFALAGLQRVLWWEGHGYMQELLGQLAAAQITATPTGSYRRGLETLGNLNLVAQSTPAQVSTALPQIQPEVKGDEVWGRLGGLEIRVVCSPLENWGTALVRSTGSWAFVQALGLLPQAGSEEAVFAALGMPQVPAYWRETEHLGQNLPANPLQRSHLQGLLHLHSTYSDGSTSLRGMAQAAIAQGYRYMLISDHSQTAVYAGGLRWPDLQRQWAEIEALNLELAPFRILRGIESEILADGSLDYPAEVLQQFDLVIGSLHSGLGLPSHEQTQRLLTALDNPHLHILGHPTGRLLLRRKGAQADWDAVLEKAAQRRIIVEINGNPHRSDLDWRIALQWRHRLVFHLATDAHSDADLAYIDWGLMLACKAGLEAEQVANTWPIQRLLDWAGR